MSFEAIFFIAIVWTVILANTGYCFYKLLTSERKFDADSLDD